MDLHTAEQLAVNGFINGTAYGLLGVSFGLVLHTTGRFHFAYAFTYTIAAFYAADLTENGTNLWLAIAIGIALGTVIGVLMERLVYRPLAAGSGDLALLTIFVASLGLSIVGENAIRLIWSDAPSKQLTGLDVSGINVGSVHFTSVDVLSVCVIWALVVLLTLILRYTRTGRVVRAVRVNPTMAQVVGINPARVYLLVFAVASLLAGVLACLAGLKFAAVPDMGFRPVFYAFVVAFLAGARRSVLTTAFIGVGLGLVESLSGLWLSSQWSSLVVFAVLFLYLAGRPLDYRALRSMEWHRFARSLNPARGA